MRTFARWVAACALALGALTVAPAHAAPVRAVVADLRGTTTITWTGLAAIRLRVPEDVLVPETSYRLTRRSGNYVSIRAFPNPQPESCLRDYRMEVCAGTWIDWLRDRAETGGHGTFATDPARDFHASLNDPPVVQRGAWDLYLFTDGAATLEITARGLSGRAAYAAAGRFAGRAVLSSGPCRLAACADGPVTTDQRIGGAAFDVGRLGFVQALAYGATARREHAPGVGNNQLFALRTCMYPNDAAPEASADPADHPDGCDTLPASSAEDSAVGVVNEAGSLPPASGRAHYTAGSSGARGRVYLGFRASGAGPERPRLGGLLIFLRYGIR